MKMPLFFMSILFSFGLFAETVQMCPLWQQDTYFQQYRCYMMESSVYRLEEISETLDPIIREKIQDEIDVIKLNLGFPVDFKDQ